MLVGARKKLLVMRAVEAMLGSNTMVLHNEALVSRAKHLKLTKEEHPPNAEAATAAGEAATAAGDSAWARKRST